MFAKSRKLVAAAALALAATGAQADLILTIDDLSTAGVDITLSDTAAVEAFLSHNGQVGTWRLSATTGLGAGWSSVYGIDLNSISASSDGGGVLRLMLTETNLAFGTPGPSAFNSYIGGTTQGTVSYWSWVDDGNAAFGTTTLLFSGTGNGAFSAAGWAPVGVTNPFSLTLQVDISHIGRKVTSFDFAAEIPEPGTLALLGLGLAGLGVVARRRRPA